MSFLADSRFVYLALCALVFPALYVCAAVSLEWSYLIILTLWIFWFVAPVRSTWGTFVIGANLLVLPVLAWLMLRSYLPRTRLSRLDYLMASFGIWMFLVLLAQSGGRIYEIGIAFKYALWMLAWLPVVRILRRKGAFDRISGAMVCGLLVTSILTIYEYYTGWNYHEWVNPGLIDTSTIERFGHIRIAGPLGHGVATSTMLALQLPFCFTWSKRFLSILAFFLGFASMLLCQGRSAWIGLLVSAAVVALLLVKKIKISVLLLLLVGATIAVAFFGWWFGILLSSFSTSSEVSANLVRIKSWPVLLSNLHLAPFFGFSEAVLSTNYYTVLGADFLEWPAALHNWFAFGPLCGLLTEIFLLAGSWYLFSSCNRKSKVPLSFRLAVFAGFFSCVIALHANSTISNMAIPMMFVYVVSVERAIVLYDKRRFDPAIHQRRRINRGQGPKGNRPAIVSKTV